MDKQEIEALTSTLCNSIVNDLNQMKDSHKQPYALAWLAMILWSISF